VSVTLTKSKNGSIDLDGDSDSIASVTDKFYQLMFEVKDKLASEREAELLAKQVPSVDILPIQE